MGRNIQGCALLAAALCIASVSQAGSLRILHAERIEPDTSIGSQADTQPGAQTLSFQAYGRQFELELTPNARLLAAMSGSQQKPLAAFPPYRGSVAGAAGSWVRITRVGNSYVGAFWDGSDLYALAPAGPIRAALVEPIRIADADTLIYRLSDTESALPAGFCAVGPAQGADGLVQYKALLEELRAATLNAELPDEQIEIALIADFEFRSQFGTDTPAQMVARINIVDGIFSEQVNVAIVIPQLRVFDTDTDPFTSNIAEDLLDELGRYRETTAEVRDRGLAHLFTGRNLEGDVAGVAFLGSLCEPYGGVGLTQASFDTLTAALISAHEIGHNFGAPHDGQAGSPCASTPQTFLMAPVFNDSPTFSQCSLNQMRPRIDAAACITTARLPDVAVSLPTPSVSAFTRTPVDFLIDVRSVGSGAASDVTVTATLPAGLVPQAGTVPGGTCSAFGQVVTCSLGTMDIAATRRISLQVIGQTAGTFTVPVSITANQDRNPDNDATFGQVVLSVAADARLTLGPPAPTGLTRQPIPLFATVAGIASASVTDVTVRISTNGMTTLSITPARGTCVNEGFSFVCALGTIAPGDDVRIDFELMVNRRGSFFVSGQLTSADDGNDGNDRDGIFVVVAPLRDAQVTPASTSITAQVGQVFGHSATIRSTGPQAVDDVTVSISAFILEMVSVSVQGGTCTPLQNSASCSLGTLQPGEERRIDVQLRGNQADNTQVSYGIVASNDDNRDNDQRIVNVTLRHAIDVALSASGSIFILEDMQVSLNAQVSALGLATTGPVTVNFSVAAGVAVQAASLSGATCIVAPTSGSCTLPSLAPGATAVARFEVIGNQPGTFPLSFAVTTADDADAGNNSQSGQLEVRPFVDVGIEVSVPSIEVSLGELFDLPVVVRVGDYPVSNVTVEAHSNYVLDSAPNGCVPSGQTFVLCTLGNLPAGDVRSLQFRYRAPERIGSLITTRVNSAFDVNFDNNIRQTQVSVVQRGDAALSISPTAVSTQVSQPVRMPPIVVTANSPLDSVNVRMTTSAPNFVIQSLSGGNCLPGNIGESICHIATMRTGDVVRIDLELVPPGAGTFDVTFDLISPFDINAGNNSQTVRISATSSPPPPPPPPSGGSGGGGGGSLSWWSLLALWLLVLARAAWRAHASECIADGSRDKRCADWVGELSAQSCRKSSRLRERHAQRSRS